MRKTKGKMLSYNQTSQELEMEYYSKLETDLVDFLEDDRLTVKSEYHLDNNEMAVELGFNNFAHWLLSTYGFSANTPLWAIEWGLANAGIEIFGLSGKEEVLAKLSFATNKVMEVTH